MIKDAAAAALEVWEGELSAGPEGGVGVGFEVVEARFEFFVVGGDFTVDVYAG